MIKKKMICILIILFIFGFSNTIIFPQSFVQDTLFVSFPSPEPVKHFNFAVDSVIDERAELPMVIGEYEVDKYWFVPVDLMIRTEESLSDEITQNMEFPSGLDDLNHFNIIIDDFRVTKKTNSLFYPRYQLNASFQVHQQRENSDAEYVGRLVYETVTRKPFFKDNSKKGFEAVVRNWQREFADDLDQISKDLSRSQPVTMENFRSGFDPVRRINMLSGADVIVGRGGWLLDGAVFFSDREARRQFFRSGGYNLRYRNARDFESVESGLSVDYLFIRFRRNVILRGKSQLMLGVNRWKDIDLVDHKFYDAFIIDYSLSQCLLYNPLDRRSLLFGIGLFEGIYYVYSKGVQFQPGVLIHMGLKL